MFTGIAALAAGTVTTATVLAAVAEVGTVLTVVGAVTGNKDLTKLGGVMGLVGGVGGLVAGAGAAAGGVAGAIPSTADTASAIAGATPSTIDPADFASLDSSTLGTAGAAAPNDVGGLETLDSQAAAGQPLTTATSANTAAASSGAVNNNAVIAPPDATAGAPQAPALQTPQAPAGPQGPSAPAGAVAPPTPASGTNSGKGPPQASSSFLGQIGSLLDNNKGLTNTLTTFGLGAFKGIADNKFNQQKMTLMQQQAANATTVASTGTPSVYNPAVGSSIYKRVLA